MAKSINRRASAMMPPPTFYKPLPFYFIGRLVQPSASENCGATRAVEGKAFSQLIF
jgi:hypothetical protein